MPVIECVPNFSEGRNKEHVMAIVDAAASMQGVKVADFNMDGDHNRSVLTLIGTPEAIVAAALAASEQAVALIDMRQQRGAHPRIGAVDVVPFIPLQNASMQDAVNAAHRFGRKFAERTGVPVYFYGEAALVPERKVLADIRRGEYESLAGRLSDPAGRPDAGPARFNPRTGATSVGARKPLVAFNVNLDTDSVEAARAIARAIRYSSGGLDHVQAIGIRLADRGIVQVSTNLTDCEATPIVVVFEAIQKQAEALGVDILESELVGLMPKAALAGTTAEYCRIRDFSDDRLIEYHLRDA